MSRQDLYVINMDWERNCYSYGGFGHLARNYRNKRIVKWERRLDYENNKQSNLNGEESLIVLN